MTVTRWFFALFLLAAALPAAAAPPSGTDLVKKANNEIASLLKAQGPANSAKETAQAHKVVDRVRDFLDINELGRRSMRDHWSKLTASQQKEFLNLLQTLIEQNYIRGLRANLQYEVVYTGEKKEGAEIIVATEINAQRRGRPFKIAIDYVLRESEGTWKAYDVITDNVGLVENYRAQFNKIINRDGVEGLLKLMRKKSDVQAGK